MKNVKRVLCILAGIMVGLLLFGGVQNAKAATISKQLDKLTSKQKTLLKNKIDSMFADANKYANDNNPDEWWFYLAYVDDNEIPEVGFRRSNWYYRGILYFSGNSVKEFSNEGKFCEITYIPKSGLICDYYDNPYDDYSYNMYSFPGLKTVTEKDYEKALEKYGYAPNPEWFSYYDMMYYLGYPELAYETYTEADLDGDGKKEIIGIRAECINNEPGYVPYGTRHSKIFINNISKYEESYNWADEGGVYISVVDINPADLYKEISVEYYDPHGLPDYKVFRYKNKKLKYLFSGYFTTNSKNDDSITLSEPTGSRLGWLYVKVDYVIKKKVLKR